MQPLFCIHGIAGTLQLERADQERFGQR